MQLHKRLRFVAYAVTLMGLAVNARADIAGSAWLVPDGSGNNCGQNAIITCIPGSTANATFTLNNNGLTSGFNSGGTDGTINKFILSNVNLKTGPAFAGGATTSTLLNTPGSGGGTDFGGCKNNGSHNCSTIFEFTGTANFSNGETFSVTSDDGFSLYVGGANFLCAQCSDPGPQGVTLTNLTYNGGPTGNQTFTFVYSECCSLPAAFSTNLAVGGNNPVPEPTSIFLLGTAMVGVISLVRRKYQA
jgi:hypothetical protein